MVGFIHHKEEDDNNLPSKLKSSIDPIWCDKFDFLDRFVPEIDDISLPVNSSFLDFDSIKDWIEEMQDPEFGQDCKSEVGVVEKCSELAQNNEFGGETCKEDPMLFGVTQEREFANDIERNRSCEKLYLDNTCMPKTEHPDGNNEELIKFDYSGKFSRMPSNDSDISPLEKSGDGERLLSLNIAVEEGLGKVSLANKVEIDLVEERSMMKNAIVSEDDADDNDTSSVPESESESSSVSSSSSSSSSSSGEDDDDEVVEEGYNKGLNKEGVCDVKELEEGEIMDADADKMICWIGDDGDDGDDDDKDSVNEGGASDEVLIDEDDQDEGEITEIRGPIKSKNELKILPPVPPVDVILQPSHQMLPVGVISSILGAQVLVEGGEKHNPLGEGSILWITERRSPLGRVDEIFGPVKNPYYIVRYNSESEMPQGMHEGTLVSFVAEFVDHVLNNKNIYQKGYDASAENDEEVLDEVEFSDDEKEAEYRRMSKTSKRGINSDKKPGANKKKNKSLKRNDRFTKNYQPSTTSMQASNLQKQHVEAPIRPPADNSIQPSSSGFNPPFPAGPGVIPGFPQQGQPSGFTPNSVQPNPMPFVIQNGQFANGFPMMNTMSWIQQQNLQQLNMINAGAPFQQAFDPAVQTSNNAVPGLPFLSRWPAGNTVPNLLNQVPLSMALHAQLALLARQGGGNGNLQPLSPSFPQNAEAPPPQFNPGAPSHRGGRPFQHRGGRSRGGRRGAQPFPSR